MVNSKRSLRFFKGNPGTFERFKKNNGKSEKLRGETERSEHVCEEIVGNHVNEEFLGPVSCKSFHTKQALNTAVMESQQIKYRVSFQPPGKEDFFLDYMKVKT